MGSSGQDKYGLLNRCNCESDLNKTFDEMLELCIQLLSNFYVLSDQLFK